MQGGWRPWWAQGSSVTYIVAPAGSSPRAAAVLDRGALGVQTAELGVEALADHLVVADEHGADQRVRADPPATALGELQRSAQVEASCSVPTAVTRPSFGSSRLIDWSVSQELYDAGRGPRPQPKSRPRCGRPRWRVLAPPSLARHAESGTGAGDGARRGATGDAPACSRSASASPG